MEFVEFTFVKFLRRRHCWNSWSLWLPFWQFRFGHNSFGCHKFNFIGDCSMNWKCPIFHWLHSGCYLANSSLWMILRAHRWLKSMFVCCSQIFHHEFCTCLVILGEIIHFVLNVFQFMGFNQFDIFRLSRAHYRMDFCSGLMIWGMFILIVFLKSPL
jgi:hypothetical protein